MFETDALDRYVAGEWGGRFVWGSRNGDCLLFLLGWAEANGHGASVAWRERYVNAAEADALLEAFGGAVAAVTDVLGPPRMGSAPLRGDVGLIETRGRWLGVIWTGKTCLARRARGLASLGVAPDIAWAVTR